MNIRAFTPKDLDELTRIHTLFYADQFSLPDFLHYVCAYVVEDSEGIVVVGGLRHILECVTVTNRAKSVKDRSNALYKILDISEFVTRQNGFDQIYVWSQRQSWTDRLKKSGFREPQGHSLILDL